MEANENRKFGPHAARARGPTQPATGAVDRRRSSSQLDDLRKRGVITEPEFAAKKAEAARTACEATSSASSRRSTETLLAWGVTPVARAPGSASSPTLPARRRHEGSRRRRRSSRLQPDLVVHVRRGEPSGGRRRARPAAGAAVARRCASSRVDDVAPALDAPRRRGRRSTAPTPSDVAVAVPAAAAAAACSGVRADLAAAVDDAQRDTYGSSVLAAIGVDNVFADADRALPEVDARRGAGASAPTSCSRRASPIRSAIGTASSSRQVAPVVLVDGQDLFWWGVRTPAAIRPPDSSERQLDRSRRPTGGRSSPRRARRARRARRRSRPSRRR